jgi:hypothetical protein
MDISIITSTYRAGPFLRDYGQHLARVAAHMGDLQMEVLVIANDATPDERHQIDDIAALVTHAQVTPVYVEREPLYASWNRGVALANGDVVGFWNVDDVRTADALIEAHRRIHDDGCRLVYFGYTVAETRSWLNRIPVPHRVQYPAQPFDRRSFSRLMLAGPFFMFARELFDEVGPFDERFRASGDAEWCARAAAVCDFCPGEAFGGIFNHHAENLSYSELRTQEDNLWFLLHGHYDLLNALAPATMTTLLDQWQLDDLPPNIRDWLVGPGAADRHRTWLAMQRDKQRSRFWEETFHMLPRLLIDKTGLRPLAHGLGLVKSPLPYT